MKKLPIYLLPFIALLFLSVTQAGAQAKNSTDMIIDAAKIKAKKIADEITDLRSLRAASLLESNEAITPKIFKKVCGPVKKKAMAIVKKEGVKIRHAAIKNRNPLHAASDEEKAFHAIFEKGEVPDIWDETIIDKKSYKRYVSPIFVEPACLSCHGERDKRPAFVNKKYPKDLAYGFKPGDLRGIIEVMIPQTK